MEGDGKVGVDGKTGSSFDRIVSWSCAVMPSVFLLIFLLHAVHIRVLVGRWPVVYRDDPSGALFHLHNMALYVSFMLAFASLPLWLLSAAAGKARGRLSRMDALRQMLLIAGAAIVLVLILRLDPTGYAEWLWD